MAIINATHAQLSYAYLEGRKTGHIFSLTRNGQPTAIELIPLGTVRQTLPDDRGGYYWTYPSRVIEVDF